MRDVTVRLQRAGAHREPTLGEVAYVAYWRGLAPIALPWDRLRQDEREAWQRAAWAVLRARDARTGREGEG